MKRFLATAFTTLSVFAANSARADELPPYEIDQKGTYNHLTMTPEYRNFTSGSLYFITSGDNASSVAEFYIDGPAGLTISARTAQLGSKSVESMLGATKGWTKVSLMTSDKPKGAEFVTLKSATPGALTSVNAFFQIHRDSCAGKSVKYITQIFYDLSSVDAAAFDVGFNSNFAAMEYPYKSGRRASIKPSSDGKYKGEPIGLFETISYENEYLNIVTWGGGSIKSQQRTPIVKYVSYKGLSLSLARIKQFLSGGNATFELTNGTTIYSVCFAKQRRRQSANGYPNP